MALLFIPIIIGMKSLYIWTNPEALRHDEVLRHKAAYLNITFFLCRAVIYFAIWSAITYSLNNWSLQQDRAASRADALIAAQRSQRLSGPGLVIYVFTMSLAGIDWVMSLEPHWFSTIFGLIIIGGQVLSAFAFVIIALAQLINHRLIEGHKLPDRTQDIGNLTLAFVMLWGYFAISQYLLIWSGNLPEEIPWYLHRGNSGWWWVTLLLMVCYFALPFLLLLSRARKRDINRLSIVAALIIILRLVDLFWFVAPELHPNGFYLHWLDLAAPIGVGGIWLAFFIRKLKSEPFLPLRDPYQQEEAKADGH
jgi:magnesium-transporting ATPase (P-type)